MDYNQMSLKMHEENHGKLEVVSKVAINDRDDLSTAYTPGVAEPCRKIHANPADVYKYTCKANTVAVVSDGTAVLGLGDIGPEAAIPVMEGKSVLFKRFAGVDAFPICLDTKDVDEIVETVKRIAPVFGGINLEDISAPRCFEIESRLARRLICLANLVLFSPPDSNIFYTKITHLSTLFSKFLLFCDIFLFYQHLFVMFVCFAQE